MTSHETAKRWSHIERFLRVDDSTGQVDDDFTAFHLVESTWSPAEQAAAYEEWAGFFEWRLAQRADELAGDRAKRHLVAKWTEDMAYCCRRIAAWARGENPGPWLHLWERRPDLDAEGQAIVAEIVARMGGHGQPSRHLPQAG